MARTEEHVRGYRTRLAAGLGALAVLAVASAMTADSGWSKTSRHAKATSAVPGLAVLYKGTEGKPPSSGPPAVAGKSVWFISCGQQTPGCSEAAAGAQEAAKVLGWKFRLYDGNFGIGDAFTKGVDQAIAAKADAILTTAIDCSNVKAAAQRAIKAGITVISGTGFDCSDPAQGGGKSLYSPYRFNSVKFDGVTATSARGWYTQIGAMEADYTIDKTNGAAKVILVNDSSGTLSKVIYASYKKELAKCAKCQVVGDVAIGLPDYQGNTIRSKFETVLLKHPEANVVSTPFGTPLNLGGIYQALVAAKKSNVLVINGDGVPPTLDNIRAGKVPLAAVVSDYRWQGWALLDALNRIFSKSPLVSEGQGLRVVDKSHNLSGTKAGKAWASSVDFRAAYTKVWGR